MEQQTAAAEDEEEEPEDLVGADDKLKPFLVPGDEIKHRYNCSRVQGVYAYPGILLFCEGHLYIIDNYKLELVKNPVGGRGLGPTYEVRRTRHYRKPRPLPGKPLFPVK